MSQLITVKPGVPMHLDDGDTPTFEEWKGRVDRLLVHHCGISLDDLPDCPTRDWYEDRVRPVRAANRALKRAGADLF